MVSLYLDDLIFTRNDDLMITEFSNSIKSEFDMTDMDKMRYFLDLEVTQMSNGVFVCQKKYVMDVLHKFDMDSCNYVHNSIVPGIKLMKDKSGDRVDNTYFKQIVDGLMYLTATRPYMTRYDVWGKPY